MKKPSDTIDHSLRKIWILFGLCALVGMIARPAAFHGYFFEQKAVFDAGHYALLAKDGYVGEPQAAFYPLWPLIMRTLWWFIPPAFEILSASLLAFIMFAIAVPRMFRLLKQINGNRSEQTWIAPMAVGLFVLNPNSLFHVLAFTESLFTLLSVLMFERAWAWFRDRRPSDWWLVVLWSALLSLTRPALLPLVAGGMAVLVVTLKHPLRRELRSVTGAMTLGAAVGYLPFGWHMSETFHNFWQPFASQSYWERKFGFYWDLILNPKSVGGSPNVLIWDIQAFYGPVIIGLVALYLTLGRHPEFQDRDTQPREIVRKTAATWMLWVGLSFAAAHGILAFLSYPIFMSLGRHVWATPFFAIGSAILLARLRCGTNTKRILYGYGFLSCLFLIHWWARYARNGWIG